MLAGGQHRAGVLGVVDRAGGQHHGVDVVRGEELLVRAAADAEVARGLGRPLGAGRGDRDQLDAVEGERVPGMDDAHAAETGDSDSRFA